MDDATAIAECRAGNAEAFRHLVERYQTEAFGHALAILGNHEDGHDAVQEAFIKAYHALDRFRPERRFYPWFYIILRNCCYQLHRRRSQESATSIEEFEILGESTDGMADKRLSLERALLELAPEERELILLKHLDGLSYDELAERLDIPAGTVMSRLYHARQHLRAKLQLMEKNTI
jgi:RNA polymerase sigma-70 factor, ECF subfamily